MNDDHVDDEPRLRANHADPADQEGPKPMFIKFWSCCLVVVVASVAFTSLPGQHERATTREVVIDMPLRVCPPSCPDFSAYGRPAAPQDESITVPSPDSGVLAVTRPLPINVAAVSTISPEVSVIEPPSNLMVPLVTTSRPLIVTAPSAPISSVCNVLLMTIGWASAAVVSRRVWQAVMI